MPGDATMRIATLALVPVLLVSNAVAAPAFRHIIIVVQENRTPDNIFGSNPTFEPGVDIATSGKNSLGQIIPLTPVALANCYDISHAHSAFEASLKHGADQDPVAPKPGCVVPADPQFKYVDNSKGTVQPYFDLATNYGFANRMFQTNQGPSFPAHQFLFGATSAPNADTPLFAAENMNKKVGGAGCTASATQTVNLINAAGSETAQQPIFPCFTHPTLGSLLDSAATPVSWRYYSNGDLSIWTAPNAIRSICQPQKIGTMMQCTGPDWVQNVVADNPARVLSDIGGCTLPGVAWVIPNGLESDHAAGNNGTGPQWVASIVNAVGNQPGCPDHELYWNDTAILITWDDWGGWYDHVKPFKIDTTPTVKWGDGYTYGFRVPLLVVSAYTKPGHVSNDILDFGSLLFFVEQNFGLGFIGSGASIYSNYADYHAAARGDMSDFFTLSKPRPFTPITSTMKATDFINAPPSSAPPDDD